MSKSQKPSTVRVRYTGAIPVTVYFVATGRSISFASDEVKELLPSEADGLAELPDYSPEEG